MCVTTFVQTPFVRGKIKDRSQELWMNIEEEKKERNAHSDESYSYIAEETIRSDGRRLFIDDLVKKKRRF